MLAKARKQNTTGSSDLLIKADALERLLDVRRKYNRRKKIDSGMLSTIDESISMEKYSVLRSGFIRRQQFRVYADLALNRHISEKRRLEVFSPKAWRYLNKDNELVGTGDLVRIRRLIKGRLRHTSISPDLQRNVIQLVNYGAAESGVFISIPERRIRKFVHIPRELFIR